jgi:hypothetical protein
MKYFFVIVFVLVTSFVFSQTAKFENQEFKLEMIVNKSLDSMMIEFLLLNKTDHSFYFEQRVPASINWSKSGSLAIVDIGTDLKSFNETTFPVSQVKPNTTFKASISSLRLKDSFNLKLKVSLYKSPVSNLPTLSNSTIRGKSGSWVWSEYLIPFSLAR